MLTNRAEIKRKLIQQARDTSYYWGVLLKDKDIRVSKDTLLDAEAHMCAWVRSRVERTQQKGQTL